MKSWEEKAHKLIHRACLQSYLAANTSPTGKRYKKHVPYQVPEIAEQLVKALGIHDKGESELQVKSLFLSYEGLSLLGRD